MTARTSSDGLTACSSDYAQDSLNTEKTILHRSGMLSSLVMKMLLANFP